MSTQTANPASEKQVALITRLVGEKVLPDGMADGITANLPTMTTRAASAVIDALFAMPRKQATPTASQEGYYVLGGEIHVVVKSKSSGRLYAKRLQIRGTGHAAWEYAPGVIYRLTDDARLTLEQAKTFGHLYGVCVVCATTLTDPKSVEAGIGPVCAKRLS